MKTFCIFLAALLSAGPALAGNDPLTIVTTTSDLAAIARAVAGDAAVVTSVCSGTEDPHFLQPKPAVILAARKADLWIRVGLDLEIGWESPVLDGSRNTKIRPGQTGHLDAAANIEKMDVPSGPVTRAMGDVHPCGNPHYWLDPYNGRIIAADMAERLAALRPDQADRFAANARQFQQALDERMFGAELVRKAGADALWQWSRKGELNRQLEKASLASLAGGWVKAMAPLKGARIITYHRSWIYFARRFDLAVAGEIEPKPGVPPTASHLTALAARMAADQVPVILQEPFYSRKAADRLAVQTGARVVVAPNSVGGAPEAGDYLALFDLIVGRMVPAKAPQ